MDTAVNIWNLLWDYQIHIAVTIVFLIWFLVRGSDIIRWILRKLRGKISDTSESQGHKK
jgi:hypothetical protein